MKIRLSELRKIVREEIQALSKTPKDDKAYQNIMSLISSALGNSPEAQKIGTDLSTAFKNKTPAKPPVSTPPSPSTLSMTSVAQQGQKQGTKLGTDQTISMRSVR